jgi:hypothetical protein
MNPRSLVPAFARIRLAGACLTLLTLVSFGLAQSVIPQYPSNQAGRVMASGYGNWSVKGLTAVAAGAGAMTVDTCFVPVGSNNRFAPFAAIYATDVPLTVIDGANTETVTPTAVTTPTPAGIGAVNPFNCGFTATFANAHAVGVRIVSGDNGLMEAINDAAILGAAYVTVDNYSGITTQQILNATTTAATGPVPNIVIEYTKGAAPGAIIPGTQTAVTATASTNTVTLTTVSGSNFAASFAGGNGLVVSNCTPTGYNSSQGGNGSTFALASGGSGGTTLTYLVQTASLAAGTGCIVQATQANGFNQPLYFALRPTTITLIAAAAASTITAATGSLTSGAYYAKTAYVDCLGGISLPSTESAQSGTITGMSLSSPVATAGACGWLPYITANGGATNTEILAKQTIDSNICPLSTLETVIPACAIGSPAVITAGNPSATSKPVVESTAHTLFGYQAFSNPPLNFQTSFAPFAAGGTINNSNADLAQFYLPAGFLNQLQKSWNLCIKGATATQVASSILTYNLNMSNNYAQSPVAVSAVLFATQTQTTAGTQGGCWKLSTAATGTSGTLWAETPFPFFNVKNSAQTTFVNGADVGTAASSALDLTKGLWVSVNAAESGSQNITAPIINMLTFEPVTAN